MCSICGGYVVSHKYSCNAHNQAYILIAPMFFFFLLICYAPAAACLLASTSCIVNTCVLVIHTTRSQLETFSSLALGALPPHHHLTLAIANGEREQENKNNFECFVWQSNRLSYMLGFHPHTNRLSHRLPDLYEDDDNVVDADKGGEGGKYKKKKKRRKENCVRDIFAQFQRTFFYSLVKTISR